MGILRGGLALRAGAAINAGQRNCVEHIACVHNPAKKTTENLPMKVLIIDRNWFSVGTSADLLNHSRLESTH